MKLKSMDDDGGQVVYDIRNDPQLLDRFRQLEASSDMGPSTKDGVIGSDLWWANVENGAVEVQRFSGLIVGTDGGPMGDWPTVRIQGENKRMSWTAWAGFNRTHCGRRVEIRYVVVTLKKPLRPDRASTEVRLQVRIMD